MKELTQDFYASRTLARNAAKENGGKVIDHGIESATGKRWGVVPGWLWGAYEETKVQREQWENKKATPRLTLGIKTGYRNRSAARVSYVHGAKDKPIPVMYKRSQVAARLAAHLAR